jgi:hypothetical protein
MRSQKILIAIILLVSCQLAFGQQSSNQWEKWNHLIGEWAGKGNGQPGQGDGRFSFQTDLDGKIIVRKNHTVLVSTANSPEKAHDDLLIVYQGNEGNSQEAIYFDSEGHTIKYKVSFSDKSIVLTSETSADVPRYRLSYTEIDSKAVNISFEIALPQKPDEFKMYLSGEAFKVK